MKEELKERLSQVALYQTDGLPIREVLVVFYHCFSRWTWYVVEAEEQEDGDWLMFCYCKSGLGPDCDEWGYTTLHQFEELPYIHYRIVANMQIKNDGTVLD